jgi:phosphatidylserine/phosphatidylglycerophosphate/cardiolipin synthase-like enzyme
VSDSSCSHWYSLALRRWSPSVCRETTLVDTVVAVWVAGLLLGLAAGAGTGIAAADAASPELHGRLDSERRAPDSVERSLVDSTASPPNESRIVAVLPDPTAEGDAGEYVAVWLTAGRWTLDDGETTVTLRGPGYVVVTDDPTALPNGTRQPPTLTDEGGTGQTTDEGEPDWTTDTAARVVRADIELSNGGERLYLWHHTETGNRTVVDTVRYREAPSGSRWLPGVRTWRPVGYQPRAVVGVGPANVTGFVLPDNPGVPVATLRAATDRILLGGYTLASRRVVAALEAAAERGVTVEVLLDADPVGGIGRRQARLLSRLRDAGVPVRLIGGDAPRYRFHHPKYAVVDQTALVMTENWKPAGTGGNGSRGWGVRVASREAAAELAAVFHHDWRGRDARRWERVRRGQVFESSQPARELFPTRFQPRTVRASAVFLLTAPGNAGNGVVSVVDAADRRLAVIQPAVERGRLLDATKRAARRGVRVRLLLSSAWYVREENRALASRLTVWADRVGASLSVRLVDPGNAFGKIHAKGVVADDTVIVGSLNWNPTSVGENREVAVAVRSGPLADYYLAVFDADWSGPGANDPLGGLFDGVLGGDGGSGEGHGGPGSGGRGESGPPVAPLLLVAAVGAVAGVGLLVRRRIRFADERDR